MKYIITGASSGLGKCIAERLIAKGNVLGISRKSPHSDLLNNSKFFHNINYDLSINENLDSFADLIEKIKFFIDDDNFFLILNAANFYSSNIRLSKNALASLFEVNVFSLINLINELKNLNLKRVLIINSIAGLIGNSHQHEYSASKHAVMGFVRSLAKSSKNANYDIMCINPGGMKTELWNSYNEVDTSDFLTPETVADICISLLSIPQRTFIENMSILPPSDI